MINTKIVKDSFMIQIKSYGATQEVTGSCHIVTIDDKKIMIDCGMFQGEEEEQNAQKFGFNPADIDYILITHAHLDHIGRIPKMVKEGFSGKIYATTPTMELAYIILMDSAKIMHEDFNTKRRKAVRKAKKLKKPLYGPLDVEKTFNQVKWINPEYDTYKELGEGISFRYKNAGHILGSAFIELSYMQEGKSKTIVFSGDIGNSNRLVLPNLQKCTRANALYVESTYGDREHHSIKSTIKEFKKIIIKTLNNKGNILIPSFAIERTQELLCILRDMHNKGELPKCKIFLDSPMATRATDVYRQYNEELSVSCQHNVQDDGTVFNFNALVYTQTPESSKAINDVKSRAIIIAGSGMCNGGRIVHHFKHRIWKPKNVVLFVGYQAKGTLGRKIVEGAEWINLYGEDIIVKASIHTINGFSAHADQKAMIKWISKIKKLKKIFLIHGEVESQKTFKEAIKEKIGIDSHIIKYEEKIVI